MTITLQQLADIVADYWPSYRVNVAPMWRKNLRPYEYERVKVALANHRAAFPDDREPNWKMIYEELRGRHQLTSLEDERRAWAKECHRKILAKRLLTEEVTADEREAGWQDYLATMHPWVANWYRDGGWETASVLLAEHMRPGRIDELMKADPPPEPTMPDPAKPSCLKTGWNKARA